MWPLFSWFLRLLLCHCPESHNACKTPLSECGFVRLFVFPCFCCTTRQKSRRTRLSFLPFPPKKKELFPFPILFDPVSVFRMTHSRGGFTTVYGVCVRVRVSPIYSITYGHKHIQYSQIHIAMIMRLVNEPAPCRQTGNWRTGGMPMISSQNAQHVIGYKSKWVANVWEWGMVIWSITRTNETLSA